MEALRDPCSRGPVFVAAPSDDLPLQHWNAYIGGLLHETVDLAALCVPETEATAVLRIRSRPARIRHLVPWEMVAELAQARIAADAAQAPRPQVARRHMPSARSAISSRWPRA